MKPETVTMLDNDTKRLSRLIAILTKLQTKQLLTATELSKKFSVSVRTIYRDMRALEQAGVPLETVEGKGYTLVEGYRIPPVMFTENQANALILAEQLVLKSKDKSFIRDYSEATEKIKAVLKHNLKEKVNLLSERTKFKGYTEHGINSNYLSELQYALTNYYLTRIEYTNEHHISTERLIEPFALLSTNESWLLVAWCRLRKTFRYFRLDRINRLNVLDEKFKPHDMTLQMYFDKFH